MKKKNSEIKEHKSVDVSLSSEHWEEFERGVSYFNNGQFQHSFEAWELLWEQCEKSQRRFLRGLMDTALGCQQIMQKNGYKSVVHNFEKAFEELNQEQYQPEFLGITVKPLLDFIENFNKHNKNNGVIRSDEYYKNNLPKIHFHKHSNPDLIVEIYEILRSKQFAEGVRLFNNGYYWESHEVWEEIWREQVGEGKKFTEAFAQLAEAYNFTKLSKFNPAVYLFEKAIKVLQEYEQIDCALMLPAVISDAQQMLANVRSSVLNDGNKIRFVKPAPIKLIEKR